MSAPDIVDGEGWGAAHRYLEAGLEVIEEQEPSRKIALLGQTFIDTFLAERDDYDLSALLKRESPLADKVFSSGSTWHSHVGWFERLDCLGTNVPWLNQLNLDAVSSLHPGTSQPIKPRVKVTHNQELRLPAPVSLEDAKSELDSLHANFTYEQQKDVEYNIDAGNVGTDRSGETMTSVYPRLNERTLTSFAEHRLQAQVCIITKRRSRERNFSE